MAPFARPRSHLAARQFLGVHGELRCRREEPNASTCRSNFGWVLYLFAAFLLITGIKMLWIGDKEPKIGSNPVIGILRRFFNVTDEHHGQDFFVKKPDPRTGNMVWFMTPLFMALLMVEIADVIFAVD